MASVQDVLQNLARDYAIAWSSWDADSVISFFVPEAKISVNGGDIVQGHAAIRELARGFFSAFPDLEIRCDMMRKAGNHALFVWTLEGHHAETGNLVVCRGWEEWDLDSDMKIVESKGWFDAADYQKQIYGG